MPPELGWQKPLELSLGFGHFNFYLSPTLDTKAGNIAWEGEYNSGMFETATADLSLKSVLPLTPRQFFEVYCKKTGYFKLMAKNTLNKLQTFYAHQRWQRLFRIAKVSQNKYSQN